MNTSDLPGLSTNQLEKTYETLRTNLTKLPSDCPRDYRWRINQLQALKRMIIENDDALNEAMWIDLRKSKFECASTEQGVILAEIDFAIQHLSSWMKPKRVSTPLFNQPGRCFIQFDPLGLVLIISAWNYPLNLLLAPLAGAIAGGNAVILKPSELADKTAKLVARLIPQYLDQSFIAVFEGGAHETGLLLDKKFDMIFYTGSGTVGKIVLSKAAQSLTPVTLELGGKSPAIVLSDADIAVAARRIAWGKFINAGQTCIAPDYVLIHPAVKEAFVTALKNSLQEFYGPDPRQSPDYCRIVNPRHFARLTDLLQDADVIYGGNFVADDLYIAPTLINATPKDPAMLDEIFGPILPILTFETLDEMLEHIHQNPQPLALYLFTKDSRSESQVLQGTSSGGVCINDVVMHMPVAGLPFGGVGGSGMGRYHGKFSFETFTHAKGVLKKATWIDLPLRYPPYTKTKYNWMKRLLSF